ncbi:T-box transcription factor TBX22 isoform X2 [Esox lucius]|uniref:T-box transcription factor TBX22 isoform X2 n=1 Tax=Esox lucius TaxID=8010 RepID=UPI0009733D91|nr:T-box transcription factor TBX22 isoform X2 [Esox lucius]
MQGLSSRAHAFSVESLVGKTVKRMKVDSGKDASTTADLEKDTSPVLHEKMEHDDQRRKAGNTPRSPGETDFEPGIEEIRPGKSDTKSRRTERRPGETEPGKEERRSRESDSNTRREDSDIRVELQGSDLWTRFHEIGTEMIITKAGRRMFPSVRVKVRNLDPCQQYYLAMDVMPVDSKRYRYVYHSSQWMVAGNTDHSCIAPRLYVHPDSPCAGETWMRQVISFDRVKLTNNEMDDKGHIILQSMHKYKPRVHVIQHNPQLNLSQIPSLPSEGVTSYSFPETEFTTVTAYQNQQITKLKIDRNPFAKGFRDPGRNRGVLDGLLESYPWRSPFNLELKPFTLQLQGTSGSPAVCTSPLKNVIPISCLPSSHPFSLSSFPCPDAGLHSFSFPLCCKTSPSSPLPARMYPSPPGLYPLPPLLSALQGKKASGCRAPCLHGGIPRQPTNLQSPTLHHRHPTPLETAPPYCLYGLPINPHLAAKLTQGSTDCLLHQNPWHTTINHCL